MARRPNGNRSVFVLTRTAGRPKYFAACAKSVMQQTYPYVHHVIGLEDDDVDTKTYVMQMASEGLLRDPIFVYYPPGSTHDGEIFYNRYLYDMHDVVKQFHTGFITYLNDTDKFVTIGAVQQLMEPPSKDPKVRIVIGQTHKRSEGEIGWIFHTALIDDFPKELSKSSADVIDRLVNITGLDRTVWLSKIVAAAQKKGAPAGVT
jgi:hypothetical protein